MKCDKCEHEQDSGKFCGKCGNALMGKAIADSTPAYNTQPVNLTYKTLAAPLYQESPSPDVYIGKVKESSKYYWKYFLEHLKRPSTILTDTEKNFGNAFVTFVLFTFLILLVIYDLTSLLFDEFPMELILPIVIALVVVFALSIGSIFVVSKIFGPQTPFLSIITMFGTYLVPLSAVILAAYLLLLMDSRGIGISLFVLGIFYSIFVMPIFVITSLVSKKSQRTDSFYAVIAYNVLFMIGLSYCIAGIMNATLTELLSGIQELFGYSPY